MRNTPPGTPRRVRSAQESKSATVRAAAAAPSRRQQSKWQREQHQQRMLIIAVGALLALVALVFAGGIFYDNVVRASETIAQIGPENVTASQLLEEVRPQARAIDSQAKQIGSGTNITDYADKQKRALPDQVLNASIDNRLIKQEADRRGISVPQSEIDQKERETVATYEASTNPAPTPEPSPTSEPKAAGQPTVGVPAIPTTPPTPTAAPTLEASAYSDALQKLLTVNGLTEADFRKQLEQSELRDKLQTAIGQDQVSQAQEQIHARQIEVEDQDQANDILNQLKGGADFASLASQFSLDGTSRTNGGDLGWFARGQSGKAKEFEDAVFALQPGQYSEPPFEDADGWHVVQVIERDASRGIPAGQLTSARQKAFDDWLAARRSQDVKLQFSTAEKDWVLERIGVRP